MAMGNNMQFVNFKFRTNLFFFQEDEKVLEVFDNLDIEDKRVVDYCAKANQAKPLALLKVKSPKSNFPYKNCSFQDAINRSIKWREVKLETRGEPVGNQAIFQQKMIILKVLFRRQK